MIKVEEPTINKFWIFTFVCYFSCFIFKRRVKKSYEIILFENNLLVSLDKCFNLCKNGRQ